MGFEPMTPVLPRLCAATAPHGPAKPTCTPSLMRERLRSVLRDDAHPFLPAITPASPTWYRYSVIAASALGKPPQKETYES